MTKFSNWIDQCMQSLSEWLWLRFSPHGKLVLATEGLAGRSNYLHLPVERRGVDPKPAADQGKGLDAIGKVIVTAVAAGIIAGTKDAEAQNPHVLCGDPYCFMDGVPCSYCGGTDASCPANTMAGWYWPYCCSGMTPATLIWFKDCCGSQGQSICTPGAPWCTNSSEPNWCLGANGGGYVCTMAINMGPCSPTDPGFIS